MNFASFKASQPAQALFRKMGLTQYLEAADSWRALHTLIVDYNDCDKGRFVAAARRCAAVCSSGEQVLLHAVLYATDFAWLADELDDGHTWRRMHDVGGSHRQAVAACIAGKD
jgi:hypothetical protein